MSSSIKNLYQFRTTSKITQAQAAASTFTVGNDIFTNTAVSITAGSIQLTNRTGSIVELFTVTVAAGVATIATRGIKPDGTTDAIYQYERPKNTLCTLTVLENQIFDKGGSETITGNLTYSGNVIYTKSAKFPVYADATARDAGIPSPANGMMIYNTALGVNQQYIGGAWADVDTGAAISNATNTSTGVGELGVLAEVAAGTATGGAGPLIVTPDVLAKQIQSGSYISLASATDSGTDTYVTTATPTLTAYTTGALFVVTFAETNTTTTPTLNIDGLGAVTITDKDSVALAVGDITTNKLILMKVGSAFKIMSELPATTTRKGIQEMATDAEALAGTDETRYVNTKQLKNWSGYTVLADSTPLLQSADTARLTVSATYVKLKEIVATVAGNYYVSFEMSENGTSGAAYAQVFKNGVAFGTEQNTNDTSRVVKNETLTFAAGDLIQLYAKHTNPATGTYVRNFRLYGVIKPVSLVLTVNTD